MILIVCIRVFFVDEAENVKDILGFILRRSFDFGVETFQRVFIEVFLTCDFISV